VITDADMQPYEGLCRKIAREYFGPGLEYDDLIQEARIGAFKGLRDWDPERGSAKAAFIALTIRRQVITGVKTATRAKHRNLNFSLRAVPDVDGELVEVLDLLQGPEADDPETHAITYEELRDLATRIRERLSDTECAVLLGLLNGYSYDEIADRIGGDRKQVDNALARAKFKLGVRVPRSNLDRVFATRRGDCGYACPGCGGATVKKPGRGRPPKCNVCRVRGLVAA
jgi:RNA polymerase sporulation-specific sigma factor